MHFDKIHNKGQAQLFRNRYVEMLTKTHPLVIWGMYLPLIAGLPVYASRALSITGLQVVLIFIAGVFFWTFFEYIMHRFVFHLVSETETGRKIIYIMHGNHHHFPRDRHRLFMPPLPSILISSVLFSLMYAVMRHYAFVFFPGFMLGYLIYGSMHYAIHAWSPPFHWMKPLWRHHHLHHYKDDNKGFGVSTTLWDRVFGTRFDLKSEPEDKQKVHELMFRDKL